MEKRKKLHCPNCGTTVKDDENSCPVCHMVIERAAAEEAEEEIGLTLKEQFPIGKVIMIGFILVGIVLTIKGLVEYQNVEYCTADDCGFKSLFIAGLGIIFIFSAGISLAREEKKYKKA